MNNIAIFASGSGTNAENIINYFFNSNSVKISLILTENPLAYVIERANNHHVPCMVFEMNDLKSGKILNVLKSYNIDYIILAGFLKLVPTEIIEEYPNRIVNIHPALLPKFGGKGMYGDRVHKAVIEAKEKESGITIHYVNQHYDEGNIVFQARCPVYNSDTPEILAKRIHELEYKYYPEVIANLLGQNQIKKDKTIS